MNVPPIVKNKIKCEHLVGYYVTTLTLSLRLKQGLAKVRAKYEAQESHFMFPGVQESVRE